MGAQSACWRAAAIPEDREGDERAQVGRQHRRRPDSFQPHHRGRRVADDAAGAAAVGRRHDPGDVPGVQPPEEPRRRDDADQRRRDVVQYARHQPDQRQQAETAGRAARKQPGQALGKMRPLEVIGDQREPDQQAAQVGQLGPLTLEVRHPVEMAARQPRREDGDQSRGRDLERTAGEQRDAHQRRGEQEEDDRNAEEGELRGHEPCQVDSSDQEAARRPT
ncbi:MAG: hypothetical protein ABUS79_12170 [Pseudomonadota bacterium]